MNFIFLKNQFHLVSFNTKMLVLSKLQCLFVCLKLSITITNRVDVVYTPCRHLPIDFKLSDISTKSPTARFSYLACHLAHLFLARNNTYSCNHNFLNVLYFYYLLYTGPNPMAGASLAASLKIKCLGVKGCSSASGRLLSKQVNNSCYIIVFKNQLSKFSCKIRVY